MLFEHNYLIYKQVQEALKKASNVIIMQGTGLGKSYVAKELIENDYKDKRVLFIVPKHAISEHLKEEDVINSNNVDWWVNNAFNSDEKILEALDNYDIFFIDECHHLGSEIYGRNLLTLIALVSDTRDKKVIGLTATPVRSCDNVYVRDFFDEGILGLTAFDAIEAKLMPPIEYLVCFTDINPNAIKKYNIKIDYESSEAFLKDIVDNNPADRWLIYFGSIKEMHRQRELVKNLFPGYEIIEISSHDRNVSLKNIPEDRPFVVCSVDMLLEGVHLPEVKRIILFRNVTSLTVFQQIIGRISNIKKQSKFTEVDIPLIIDTTRSGHKLLSKLLSVKFGYNVYDNEVITGKARDILYTRLRNKGYMDLSLILKNCTIPLTEDEKLHYAEIAYRELGTLADIPKSYVIEGFDVGEWLNSKPLKKIIRERRIERGLGV